MVVTHNINLTNIENLSTTVKTALYPAIVAGNDTIRSIVACSKEFSADVSGYNNPPGSYITTFDC